MSWNVVGAAEAARRWPLVAAVALTLSSACAPPEDDLGATQQEARTYNAITHNALVHNAIVHNAIVHNALTENAITHNAITHNAIVHNALRDDPLARQFLQYTYSCAMPAGVTDVIDLTDDEGNIVDSVALEGALGLAPEWADGSCNLKCQMWVSACLLARTNAFGVPVEISLRGDGLVAAEDEVLEFPLREGTYYGNIFRTENEPGVGLVNDPHLYACSGPDSNKGMVTARFCSGADSSEACAIQVAGPCTCAEGALDCIASHEGVCDSFRESDSTPYGCWTPIEDNSDVRKFNEALTVYLREPMATCGDLRCDPDETPVSCPNDCFNHAWAFLPGLISKDSTIELAPTPDGAVIVAGTFWNTLDFGPAGLLTADPSHQLTPGWDSPGFLAKIDPNTGTPIWATALGTEITSVATDAEGNVFVAGATGSDYTDVTAWITKLPASGDPNAALWSVDLPGAVPPIGVGVDPDGNVVVAGSFYEKLYFDGEHQPRLETGKKSWATFMSKLSGSDASPMWMEVIAASLGGPHDRWSALAVGPGVDDIYMTGAGGSWCGDESCLEKYSGDGQLIWSVPLAFSEPTGTIVGNPRDAAVAEDGTVYVTGRLLTPSGEPRDVFIARYSGASAPPPAAPLWWSHIANSGFDPGDTLAEGTELVLTPDGEAVVAGSSPKSPDVDATGFYDGALGDVDDIYTAGFGTDTGDRQWVRHAGGAYQDYVEALAVAPGGRIVIAGRFVGSMLFEGTVLEIPADVATANPDSWGLFIGSYLGETDSAPPVLSLPSGLTAEALGPSGAPVSFTATATDLLDGAVTTVCAPPSGSQFTLGSTPVICNAVDTDGNEASGQFTVTVVDSTAPALTVPGGIAAEANAPAGAIVLFEATAVDLVDGNVTPTCVPASGSTFAYGSTPVTCSATDAHDNTGSATFTVLVADTLPPVITVPEDIATDANVLGGAAVTFDASALDAADGPVPVSCDPASGDLFPVGQTTVVCSAADAHGNSASASFSVTVEDSVPPDVYVPVGIEIEGNTLGGAEVPFTVSAADQVSGDIPSVSCDWTSGDLFPVGDTEVTCSALDDAGNEGSASFWVTVTDTTEPALELPADIEVEAEGASGASLSFTAAAHDIVDGDLEVTCTPSSPTTFSLGSHLVSCTATDAAGNKASGSFAVTVADTTPPTLTLSGDLVVEATGPDGAEVSFTANASDLVDGSIVPVCTPLGSGSVFGLGTTNVHCTATDAMGNAASGDFTITVRDTQPPTISPLANLEVEAANAAGVVVTFSASATDVVSGALPVSCDPPSGETFPLGDTVVTCTATDAAGNEAAAGFLVSVEDTLAPVLALPADIIAEAAGPDGAVVTFETSANDLVSGDVEVECAPASGTVFALGTTTVSCWAVDDEDNLAEDTFQVAVQDTTPPVITVPSEPVVAEYAGEGGTAVTYAVSAEDLVDGAVEVTCTPDSGSLFDVGVTTVSCSAVDAAGNAAETATFDVEVHYTWTGFGAPLDKDGKVFKQGSNIPVKFALTGDDASVTDLYATLWVAHVVDGEVTGEWAPASSASAVEGNEFRYSPASDGYIFDLDTDNMVKGTWRLRAELYDGADRSVQIRLN